MFHVLVLKAIFLMNGNQYPLGARWREPQPSCSVSFTRVIIQKTDGTCLHYPKNSDPARKFAGLMVLIHPIRNGHRIGSGKSRSLRTYKRILRVRHISIGK